jgi:signal transduction histidine kinase
MDGPRRAAGPLLLLGAAAFLASIPFGAVTGTYGLKETPWLALGLIFLSTSAFVRSRLPEHPTAQWFAILGALFGLVQALDGSLGVLIAQDGSVALLAVATLGYHLATIGAVVAIAHVLGLFPDGRVATATERRALAAVPALVVVPVIGFVVSPTVLLPTYHDPPVVANPFHVPALQVLEPLVTIGLALAPAVFLVGLWLLVRRYRAGSSDVRRQIRWLLLPALFAGVAAILEGLLAASGPDPLVSRTIIDVTWVTVLAALPITITIALLRPNLLDVDRVLRRSLVYGALWSLIALAYVTAAAALGMAAGRRLDVGVAILLTVAATLVFQPARQRLERVADRWVFGPRVDSGQLVRQLGATLAETVDQDDLLPRIERTLRDGLGLSWAEVRLEAGPRPAGTETPDPPPGAPVETPALTTPIVLGSEVLGEVRCGPRTNGVPLSEDDRALVVTLARQAALAIRNVKLTAELADRLAEVRDQATELERSRVRLVRAQETERRRIERNIHDGVQQDLVVLLGQCGRIRTQLDRDPAAATDLLDQFHAGLQRVIADLRELAQGIHPTLLTDRGLLEAVEALANRSPIPVVVRADPSLRGLRFAEEVEGAGYFTVAEALTNVLKHAGAAHAEVRLQRANGSLHIEVRDDGIGIDSGAPAGSGLQGLSERLAALGGRLDVDGANGGTTVHATLVIGAPHG